MGKAARADARPTDQQTSYALRQAQESLDKIVAHSDSSVFDSMDKEVKRLLTIVAHPHFPKPRAKLFVDMASAAQIQTRIKESQRLLEAVSDASVSGDRAARHEAIIKARQHVAQAIKVGANPNISERLDKIIEILVQTTKPGIDAAAKAEAVRRTAVTAEWTGGKIDKRKAIRISSPRLSVLLNGSEAYTNNWSMYGLSIVVAHGFYHVGKNIRFRLQSFGMNEPTEMMNARVVRFGSAEHILCVEFSAISTQILMIARHLKVIGLPLSASEQQLGASG